MRTAMTTIDKIAWIHLDHGKILSTRSRSKDAYYIPGGKNANLEKPTSTPSFARSMRNSPSPSMPPQPVTWAPSRPRRTATPRASPSR